MFEFVLVIRLTCGEFYKLDLDIVDDDSCVSDVLLDGHTKFINTTTSQTFEATKLEDDTKIVKYVMLYFWMLYYLEKSGNHQLL